MRENGFAALAVIHRAAGEIASDGHTNDGWRFECSVRTPPHHGQLIAKLHHGRPDVIEKLNFSDGLESASGHADGPAHDAGLRKRSIEDAVGSIFALESGSGFENRSEERRVGKECRS